jgi:thiamine monophosphate kinase
LSISATSIGRVSRQHLLTRRKAQAGDSIFISRPLGLTPAAFYIFMGKLESRMAPDSLNVLRRQFTDLEPMLTLGQALGASGLCGACMDNTDGIGQSLTELSDASGCSFILDASLLSIPPVVYEVSQIVGTAPLDFVFNGGADFSLVGTIRGDWTNEKAEREFGHALQIIGHAESGAGVWLNDSQRRPLSFSGWNYFSART